MNGSDYLFGRENIIFGNRINDIPLTGHATFVESGLQTVAEVGETTVPSELDPNEKVRLGRARVLVHCVVVVKCRPMASQPLVFVQFHLELFQKLQSWIEFQMREIFPSVDNVAIGLR
jgi:hypothetical protein